MGRTKDKHVKSGLAKFLKKISREEANIFSLEEKSINKLLHKASQLFKSSSKEHSKEAYNHYHSTKRLFSDLKIEHKLPKAPEPTFVHEEIKEEIIKPFEIPAVKEMLIREPTKIRPPKMIIVQKKKIEIKPPRIPEKKISDRMKKLMEEKESVYNKLKEVEGKELDRFKQTKRLSVHEDIGYHDFIRELRPKSRLNEEHRIKKIFEAK
jgi:hypothetical protein